MTFSSFCATCPYYTARNKEELSSYRGFSGNCVKRGRPVADSDWCAEHPENSIPDMIVEMEPEDPDNHVIEPTKVENRWWM